MSPRRNSKPRQPRRSRPEDTYVLLDDGELTARLLDRWALDLVQRGLASGRILEGSRYTTAELGRR